MFRKPREAAAPIASETDLRPSTGRPPTPPSTKDSRASPISSSTTYSMAASTPLQIKTTAPPKRTPLPSAGKAKGKPNGNIMSFFKKAQSTGTVVTDKQEEDDILFLENSLAKDGANTPLQTPTPPREESSNGVLPEDVDIGVQGSPLSRYNEDGMPSKRRRTEITREQSQLGEIKAVANRGPFIDDSDSDDQAVETSRPTVFESASHEKESEMVLRETPPVVEGQSLGKHPIGPAVPNLKRETTSIGEANDFDGVEDFIDDEFPEEGEEYLERRWMEEQAEFEEGLEEEGQAVGDDTMEVESGDAIDTTKSMPRTNGSPTCPICGGNTAGLTDQV